ncbi:MAG: hypothetical protein B9S27_05035 [Opitutia bacterium Tous-C8FEB]|nr:MAG: hypothetical protein B9S27_05035 [Opitutae bacterium Tous-C8FEB]
MNPFPFLLRVWRWSWLGLVLAVVGEAGAQTFCSVREPNRLIREMFPRHTGFRTEMLEITAETASKLPADLPFVFDRREVTRHPLFIVMEGERIVGYVQARTQPTRWGLTEYVWALDAQLALLDFRVQRSREPGADRLGQSRLAAVLRGLTLDQVRRRWSDAWLKELQSRQGQGDVCPTLVEGAVAAGLKTIWLTQEIWQVNRRATAPVGS